MVKLFLWLLVAGYVGLVLPGATRAELAARNLLLVVNRNAPDGVALATYYAKQRGVPPAQIVQLDLPTGDEVSIDDYERLIADPLRVTLASAAYAQDIRCIVTFYGVPFRIPPRPKDGNWDAELKLLATQFKSLEPRLAALADEAERLTRESGPDYKSPPSGTELVDRVRKAALAAGATVPKLPDAARRQQLEQSWKGLLASGREPLRIDEPGGDVPATQRSEINDNLRRGAIRLYDSAARKLLRAEAQQLGVLVYAQVLDAQMDYLFNDQTDSAVDSELACLRWNVYRRTRWQGNPLRFDAPATPGSPATYMTMRLDGPGVKVVQSLIDDGISVEQSGLRGKIVLDSRNIPLKKPDGSLDGYGRYDETLRNLRDILDRGKCSLPVVFDDSDQLIADDSQSDIAVYCGWYNPDKVHLPGKFVRGAVGFHIASYTAISIRGLGGGLWTPEMLNAGVVSTLGAVSEPYLHSFPDADAYVPLLLTGQLTMAEAYWRTAPMTSWKIVVIGDPLYSPFRTAPAIRTDALPAELRAGLSDR